MLKNSHYILALCLLFGLNIQAQVIISGVIKSSGREPISNATISLKDSINGITLAFAISKTDGIFLLKKQIQFRGDCILTIEHISSLGKTLELKIHSGDQRLEMGEVILDSVIRELKNIVITSHAVPFSIRGDTVEFKAKSFKIAETRKVEDLLRNIQGFDMGSDGKISFNGKEVDRILIEGEDLTEKNYQLLSRNLNANLVDKVQVINNFSTDRLLKEVENSGKVGINLTIDEKFKNKLSGGIEAGYGIGKRAFLDNNLVYLTRKLKLLSFLNYNETGLPANINLQYYFNQGESSVNSSSSEQSVNGILQTGNIYLPSIGQSYIRDNEDISSFIIGSWKSGQHFRMKALAGIGRSRLKKNAEGINQFLPADGNSWEMFQKEKYRTSKNESIIKFSLAHDQKKNNTGFYSVDLLGNQYTDSYENLSKGAITDSLHEFLPAKGRDYKIVGKETWKIGKGKILKAGLLLKRGDILQNFQAMTNRYQDFFMLDSSFIFYNQKLKGVIANQEFDIAIVGRNNFWNWSTGARLTMERTSYDANARSTDIDSQYRVNIFQAPSRFHSFRAMVFGIINRPIQKKGLLSSGMSIGAGHVKINQENSSAQRTAPVFKGMIGYTFALSPIKNLSLQFSISQHLPERIYFHPLLLLAGQATILNPSGQLVSRSTQSLNFSYASHSLHKGSRFVIYTSYSLTNGVYTYSTLRTPAYGLLYYLSQNGNQMWNVNIKLDQYVKQVRTKFSIELSSHYISTNMIYNEVKSLNKMGYLSLLPKAVTAFKGPFNLEASFTAMYTRNITIPESGTTSKGEVWQYQGYGKLKIQSGKKLYIAMMYNYYILAPKNFFQTMDAYVNFTMNQAWIFSFSFHNLFNNSSIVQRQLSVNSVSEQRYGIVGRYVLVKAQWSF